MNVIQNHSCYMHTAQSSEVMAITKPFLSIDPTGSKYLLLNYQGMQNSTSMLVSLRNTCQGRKVDKGLSILLLNKNHIKEQQSIRGIIKEAK